MDEKVYFEGNLVLHSRNGHQYFYDKENKYGLQASSNGLTYVHKVVGYRLYGDASLDENAELHHIDENKDNNDPTNIILLTKGEHSAVHNFLKKHPNYNWGSTKEDFKKFAEYIHKYIDYENGDEYHDTKLKIDRLVLWDKEKNRDEIKKLKTHLRKIEKKNALCPPTKEDLLEVLKNSKSYNNAARTLKVSNYTLDDWCEMYDIDKLDYTMYKIEKINKICPTCGKEFVTTKSVNQTYCCIDCMVNKVKNTVDKDEVVRLYNEENLSTQVIAEKFGISTWSIKKILKENNSAKKYGYIHDEEFCKKVRDYHKEFPNESQRSLGRKFNVDRTTIKAILEKYECL